MPRSKTSSWASQAGDYVTVDRVGRHRIGGPLEELTRARIRELTREPEAVFHNMIVQDFFKSREEARQEAEFRAQWED